jgi:hypothetical protein
VHVNHRQKTLFFHVPKTGGTAIHTAFSDHTITTKDKWEFYLGMHGNFTDLKYGPGTKNVFNKLIKYWKFCFVRNPWSHAVSLYFNMIDSHRWEKEEHPQPIENYKNFNWFLKTYDGETPLYRPQSHYTFYDKEFKIDKWYKYEQLQEAWDDICERFNYKKFKLPVINTTKPRKNRFDIPYPEDYRTFYDDESIEYVTSKSKNEIRQFNYRF